MREKNGTLGKVEPELIALFVAWRMKEFATINF